MRAAIQLAGCVIAASALAGCGGISRPGGSPRIIGLAEFAGEAPEPSMGDQAPGVEVAVADSPPASAVGDANQVFGRVEVRPELDEDPGMSSSIEPGEDIFVDSMVGQIRGRPIFAHEFFEPIDDELRRAAERMGRREFEAYVTSSVRAWLDLLASNEVLLAEAEASLTIQQQQGLLAMLRELRGEEIRRRGGSRQQAERSLLEAEGITLDEFMAARRDRQLILYLLSQKVWPRVVVSWRDIELEYQRLYAEFNSPASMTVLRISLREDRQADLIVQVNERLARGDPFEQIAIDVGMPEDLLALQLELDEAGNPLVDNTTLAGVLGALEIGETSSPVQLRNSIVWFHVASVESAQQRTIYDRDVQLALTNMIRNRRRLAEEQRYVLSLLKQGGDSIDRIAERLLQIAMERYGR
jgi:hypothetical protein